MKRKVDKDYIFMGIYLFCLVGASIIGLFSNAVDTYEAFNSLWADILYITFVSLLYVAAFVHEVLNNSKTSNVVLNGFIFIGCMIFALLMFCLSGILTLLAVIYAIAMFLLVLFNAVYKLRKDIAVKIDVKQMLCALSLIVLAAVRMLRIEFISETYIAWSLIPTAVFFIVIVATAIIPLRTKWKHALKKTGEYAGLIVCIFALTFFCSFTIVGLINCECDVNEPVELQCTVLDKNVQTGYRQITQFEIKVNVEGKDRWINVPVTEYHEIEKQDTVIIEYYKGALNFAYLKYGGQVTE